MGRRGIGNQPDTGRAQFQVAAYRDKRIDGVPFLLYGRLDALKAGTIYDTKFVRRYEAGKYVSSPQHPMYFDCVPEASRFVYVVSDGKFVYQEEYRRGEVPEPDRDYPGVYAIP